MTVVWVANRDKPLNDSSGTLEISSDGNLVILDARKEIVWSTKVSTYVGNVSVVLLDTGNLVLQDSSNTSSYVWESFQHASDSFLEKMRLFTDLRRNQANFLTSWRSSDDPGRGSFTSTIEPDVPESFVRKDGLPYWRSGPWNGQIFTGMPYIKSIFDYGTDVGSDSPGYAYETFAMPPDSSVLKYYVLNSSGSVEEKVWSDEKKGWDVTWSSSSNECDMYGKCGPFGVCNSEGSPICTCFRGFVPKRKDEWEAGNWTSGCMRGALLKCEQNSSVGKQDGFVKVQSVKLPHHYILLSSFEVEGECEGACLSNCSCIAYAEPTGIGCMHWVDNLTDTHKFSYGAEDLYIRLPHSQLCNMFL